ncbi:hypothetical protein AKG08_24795 [Achromobacter piechaudii]|uniref:hypothetical protein n=1 Tax=Achromobacter piechaudii TaxID=72556 RepID=UPI00067FDFA8|nr:hypothetical protein [Achromobacter piechaudii]KNY05606.1 hypothetical protein AKG08_24795 [Achromobacter piechaudii]
MHKPIGPGSNVHILNQPHESPKHDDVLGTLYAALARSSEERATRPPPEPPPNEQRIEGDGNMQIAGETAPRQSISGNNNIQIGAVQLVVNVMLNVER